PQSGAFSRTAVMSRSGSKTPMAGLFTGLVVILALYVLTAAFYYIPDAILSAVVIHAVADLVSKPSYLIKLYKTSIIELFIWLSAVLIIVFVDVETGIYTSVGLSLLIMLLRTSRPPVKTLARIPLAPTYSNIYPDNDNNNLSQKQDKPILKRDSLKENQQQYIYVDEKDMNFKRYCHPLPPGIMVFRIYESIVYPNAEHISDQILTVIKSRTRCGDISNMIDKLPWNQGVDKNIEETQLQLPILKALVLDFAAVRRIDSTALHTLVNLRIAINRYAGNHVDWYIVGIQNHRIRDGLIFYGFGENVDQ
ncbi:sulfate transporter family-domain-containing protein, partial [Cunninghamella echinulata]